MANSDATMSPIDELLESVRDRYNDRILAFLSNVRASARALGYTFAHGPYEMSDDMYRWEIVGRRPGGRGDDSLVDFSFTIVEARQMGDEPDDGVNFSFDVVEYGGRILGGISPYNFTSRVWVKASDAQALEERFRLLETSDMSGLADILR